MSAAGRAAVFGQPIGHSKSPALHRAAYAELGVDLDYWAIEAGASEAARLARMLRDEPGWRGASVTMPLKQAMVPLMDSVSERVSRLGVLNTIVASGSPGSVRLHGENTDVDGIVQALGDAGATAVRSVAILGAGGTATAATAALQLLGARQLDFVVRDAGRAADVLALAAAGGCRAEAVDAHTAGGRMHQYDAVVSTLPPHAADEFIDALGLDGLAPGTPLLDVAYDPWPSAIAAAWSAAGGSVVGGLSMLVHQAVGQVRLFTGTSEADWPHVTNVMCDAVGLPHPIR
ncbi:shikimate dehydrogenase [Arthrobacter sp. JSM 101049]|uniref:shikimate dehydrogenase family protein n=1 Tax=Arthrobacter sp. JSM 101049 TaxID=929097 RepID=UPI00356B52E6